MDDRSLRQIQSFWPDVVERFRELIPEGLALIRTEDDWIQGRIRTRAVSLVPLPDAPDLNLLLEEAEADARLCGWDLYDEDDGAALIFERERVLLKVRIQDLELRSHAQVVLRLGFEQPWPPDYGAPVETSQVFQNLVRNLLGLGGEPHRLSKEVVLHPLAPEQIDALVERTEIACGLSLIERLERYSFSPPEAPGGLWTSVERTQEYALVAAVRAQGPFAQVELAKRRHAG